jgi:hypothetical protein
MSKAGRCRLNLVAEALSIRELIESGMEGGEAQR